MPFLLLKRLIHHRFQDALRRHYGQLPGGLAFTGDKLPERKVY
jgi:hypothetical protein